MHNDMTILAFIADRYLNSRDFNGVPVHLLCKQFSLNLSVAGELIARLLHQEQVDVMFGNVHPNTHIRAFSHIGHEQQLDFLTELGLSDTNCVYPSKKYLATLNLSENFADRPYTLELALGSGQLDYRVFDLSVLEYYRNDPRYYYETNFISGSISVTDEFFESDYMPNSDQVLLQTFGFAYDLEFNRAVAVFLRYLKNLTPEHQLFWRTKTLTGDYTLHPDYYRFSILGDWGTRISIFEALPLELKLLNEMASIIRKPPLFLKTFDQGRPKEFGFLLRPTLAEFNAFVLLLDKMLSDNINKDFFKDDTALEKEVERSDGKIVVQQKSTLTLLKEWLIKCFPPEDLAPLDSMFNTLRDVRRLRQKPAHAVNEDVFDLKYFKKQRSLMIDAYEAVRNLRLVIAEHPEVRRNPPKIQEHLARGEIWDI